MTPGSNKKFFDRGVDTVWIGQDPNAHTLERLTFVGHLFQQYVSDLTIHGGDLRAPWLLGDLRRRGVEQPGDRGRDDALRSMRSGVNINGGDAPGTYMSGIEMRHCLCITAGSTTSSASGRPG